MMRCSVLAALAALAALPAVAAADATAVLRDCQDSRIDGSYSQREFSDALRSIPTDGDEYTDCRDVIRRAQLGAAGGGGDGGAGGTGGAGNDAFGGTGGSVGGGGQSAAQLLGGAAADERDAVSEAIREPGEPVELGGRAVSPRTAGLSPAGAANVLPTPLIVALVLLGLGLALAAAQTVRSHVLARRAAPA